MNNKKLAAAYHKLLVSIDWEDELLVAGISEGLSKFLSNAYLSLYKGNKKHFTSHYFSGNAIKKVENNDFSELVFEHIVPKDKFIQKICKEKAKDGTLTIDFIENLLERYWKIATITKAEDKTLISRNMPKDWDGTDILARYNLAKVKLIENPFNVKNKVY
jgi:hypothetical protein